MAQSLYSEVEEMRTSSSASEPDVMESHMSAGMATHMLPSPDNELNDYEDDESEDYEDYEDYGGECGNEEGSDVEHDCEGQSECDSVEVQDDLARAAFGDLVASNLSLGDEKLLDMLQRRLFSSATSPSASSDTSQRIAGKASRHASNKHSDIAKRVSAPATSPQEWLGHHDSHDLRFFSLAPAADSSTISPEKIGKMVHRFRLQEEKRAHKLRMKREAAEHSGHTYAPALNRKSLQMAQRIPKFLDRQRKHLLHQQQQREWHKQTEEQERTRDRTLDLEEHVKTPCICSRGSTTPASSDCAAPRTAAANTSPSRVGGHNHAPLSSAPGGQQTHTRSCLRFMEMCSRMNKSFAIQRRKDQMRRSIDDMLAFHEEKKQRQRARSEIARAQEAMNATFTPQINPRSEKVRRGHQSKYKFPV